MTKEQVKYVYEIFQLGEFKESKGENNSPERKELQNIMYYEIVTSGTSSFRVATEKFNMVLDIMRSANAKQETDLCQKINQILN